MNRREKFGVSDISDKDFVLATDLDGTFLGGSDEQRKSLYSWIETNRSRVGLIFVTGRDPGFIHDLTRKMGVPRPDFVIADVGTTIATMDRNHIVSPIPELEEEIAVAWGDAGSKAQFALTGAAGLRLQSTLFRYRLSYDMDPALFDEAAVDTIAELGLDTIVSDNRFFDVLPKGVSKGPSLLRLLTHLGIDNRRVLVAGDTMNDLTMLKMGLPAVAVGGSEPALIDEVEDLEHVYAAQAEGAAGIAEAILHHNLFTAD
ncbi:HAD-IIB family hydrolase [Roseisalinus antarcticus]|uniref:Mannosylfructose-phosphate phosphatase n=1 Tax=Roseisalinus antarcticus TaxID=254357 RepID=A0A1Y5T165_9RHOB|nr:HAD-IIB family hydrolase [Roseisalinus antarcticus]SLN53087.1 Mannosylfructose-phosphate phosphatase [Roseisalinus antarcticus]